MERANPRLKQLIIQVVNNQLRSKDPPETGQTLDRLVSEGYTEEEAKELIAIVVTAHISDVLNQQQAFNVAKYVDDLNRLPELPQINNDTK
jgi:hypothetical protein